MATLADVGEYRVDVPGPPRIGRLADESAEEDAVDPVLPHPPEVQQHRPRAIGAVEPRRRSVRHLEARDLVQVFRVILRDVGPHVHREAAAIGSIQALSPVDEAEARAVAGRVEPSLVAAEDLAVERRGIHVGAGGTGVGMEPRLVGSRGRGLHRVCAGRGEEQEGQEHRDRSPVDSRHQRPPLVEDDLVASAAQMARIVSSWPNPSGTAGLARWRSTTVCCPAAIAGCGCRASGGSRWDQSFAPSPRHSAASRCGSGRSGGRTM